MGKRFVLASLLLSVSALVAGGCGVGLWVPLAPPDALVEVHGGMPGPEFVWIGGYWQWHSRWVWEPGHWERPPHVGARWEAPHWEHGARGWRFHRGRWR
jgi:hypothetical protein